EHALMLERLFELLCTRLIDEGHLIYYGGKPEYGFTEQLQQIEERAHREDQTTRRHVLNYVAAYQWAHDGHDHAADYPYRVRIEPATPGTGDVAEAHDLTRMRQRLTADVDVRICVGGNLRPTSEKGKRRAPGIVEEAYLSLQRRQPLMIAGGFGGAA